MSLWRPVLREWPPCFGLDHTIEWKLVMADTAALVNALGHTLSPDKETRVQAEAALSQVGAAA